MIPYNGNHGFFFFLAPSSFMAHVVTRVILSLLHDAVAPAAPRGGIPAAFILLEGDIYDVLGGDVPLIISISEVKRLQIRPFSTSSKILYISKASAPLWRSGDNITTPNITTHAVERTMNGYGRIYSH